MDGTPTFGFVDGVFGWASTRGVRRTGHAAEEPAEEITVIRDLEMTI